MRKTGGQWRWAGRWALVVFFLVSIVWQTRARADQSLAEQLLEIMRANHQISEAQYKKLKKEAEAKEAAEARTEREYKELKRQVEEKQEETHLQYEELKKQTERQEASQAAPAQQVGTEKSVSAQQVGTAKTVSAQAAASCNSLQRHTTGTGNSCGGMNFNMHGISVNIGGFIEAAGIYRDRWLGADVDSPFQNLPLSNNPHFYQDETRFTARQSRLSILAQGDYSPTVHLGGYYEMDFLGAAPTANSNESNSYNMRIRHLYTTADWDTWGLHLLGGQSWSLLTTNTKGIIPRDEAIPLTIDAQYVPGFNWARQPQFRIVKDWDKTFWLGLSVENPQTTYSSEPDAPADFPINYALNQTPGSLFASNLSVNDMPDIIEKAAYDSPIGHFEVFNLTQNFASNLEVGSAASGKTLNDQSVTGDAVGGSLIIPLYGKELQFLASSMYGQGIGRYGSGQLPDVTQSSSGAVHPITALHVLGNLTWTPCKALTVYGYFGMEQADRKYYTQNGVAYGYGNPLYDTFVPGLGLPGKFQGQIQAIQQFTLGEWWNFYHGDMGNMVWGLQYSYTTDNYFSGTTSGPQANDSMIFSSLRYYWN